MMTSSSPCLRHSAAMYSASSLLRFDPATWGSAVKTRCWRRSSNGLGMDLNLDSIWVSRAEEAAVKPRIEVWACARGNGGKRNDKRTRVIVRFRIVIDSLSKDIDLLTVVPPANARARCPRDSRQDAGATENPATFTLL